MAVKKTEAKKPGVPDYMATYGDLVTLLMCFFVLLFSMSTIEATKFEQIASALSGKTITVIDVASGGESILPDPGNNIMQQPVIDVDVAEATEKKEGSDGDNMSENIDAMVSDFQTYFAENNLAEAVEIIVERESLRLRFPEQLLFDSGKADIKPAFYEILDIIAEELFNYPDSELRVEGHTDNRPIGTIQYPSNDYLSSARAISVVKYIRDEKGFDPGKIEHVGYGEFRPIADNDTPEGRAKNRRVEFIIFRPE